MRIFIAIDLDPEIRTKISAFLDGVRGFAPDARWVRPESLHVTLKFIGEQKPEQVEAVGQRLREISAAPFDIRCTGHGFFPTAKAPRVFWIGIESDPPLAALATTIDTATAELGIPREDRPFSPHLTLARGYGSPRGGRSTRSVASGSPKWQKSDGPNSMFAVLQKRLAAMTNLDLGAMTAREFCLYESQLSPGGSKYTKLEKFSLK